MGTTNVRLAVTGSVCIAPPGAAKPLDASSALSAAWVDVGFISEAGVVETVTSSPTDITPWRSGRVARRSPGVTSIEYKFSMLETNVQALRAFYGATVNAGDLWHHVEPESPGRFGITLTVIDGLYVTRRWVPLGEFTATGGREFATGGAAAMEVTLLAYPVMDAMGDGLLSRAVAFYSEPLQDGGVPEGGGVPCAPGGAFDGAFG